VRSVLHITSARDTTTDLVVEQLDSLDVTSLRLNTECFPTDAQLSLSISDHSLVGQLTTDSGRTARLGEVGAIYYRRPLPASYEGFPQLAQESERFAAQESGASLAGFLRLLGAAWVNDPDLSRCAERKAPQLTVAQSVGLPVPRTLITNDPDAAVAFIRSVEGRVIAKTVKSPLVQQSTGRLAYAHVVSDQDVLRLDALCLAPCIFQEYIEKDLECRVVVVGERVFTVEIYSQGHPDAAIDWRQADYRTVRHEWATLPPRVEEACRAFARAYGLKFAVMDLIRRPDGRHVFLECNPNGEWAWLEGTTGVPIARAIAELLAGSCPT
jgi:glutathione synthase/RimK-type ligase-like ATP-grasp enzyme